MANSTLDIRTNYEVHGIRVDNRWIPFIEPIRNYIDKYNDGVNIKRHIRILSVTEKYNRLHIVTSGITTELQELIDDAVEKSRYVCMYCGGATIPDTAICNVCLSNLCN